MRLTVSDVNCKAVCNGSTQTYPKNGGQGFRFGYRNTGDGATTVSESITGSYVFSVNNVAYNEPIYESSVNIYPLTSAKVTLAASSGTVNSEATVVSPATGSPVSLGVWGVSHDAKVYISSEYSGNIAFDSKYQECKNAILYNGSSADGVSITANTPLEVTADGSALGKGEEVVTYAIKASNFAGRYVRITNVIDRPADEEVEDLEGSITLLEGHFGSIRFKGRDLSGYTSASTNNSNIISDKKLNKKDKKDANIAGYYIDGDKVYVRPKLDGEYGTTILTLKGKDKGDIKIHVTSQKFTATLCMVMRETREGASHRGETVLEPTGNAVKGELMGFAFPSSVNKKDDVKATLDYGNESHTFTKLEEKAFFTRNGSGNVKKRYIEFRPPISNENYGISLSATDNVTGKTITVNKIECKYPVNLKIEGSYRQVGGNTWVYSRMNSDNIRWINEAREEEGIRDMYPVSNLYDFLNEDKGSDRWEVKKNSATTLFKDNPAKFIIPKSNKSGNGVVNISYGNKVYISSTKTDVDYFVKIGEEKYTFGKRVSDLGSVSRDIIEKATGNKNVTLKGNDATSTICIDLTDCEAWQGKGSEVCLEITAVYIDYGYRTVTYCIRLKKEE